MGDAGLDLLGLAHIPELLAQVAAGPADDIHLPLVLIVANRAFPLSVIIDDDLAIEAADVAVVALGIELGILDVVVNELHDLLQGFQILAHVGYFRVGDATATGDGLELVLEGQLRESIDVLTNIYMVAIRIIALVGDIGDVAEPLAVDAGEPVAERFGRGSIEGKPDVGLSFPVVAGLPQPFYHPYGKLGAHRICVADSLHELGGLVEANVAQRDGRITAIEQWFNGLPFAQPGDGAVLPVQRAAVGSYLLQSIVPAHQSLEAKLQALVQQGPELLLISCGKDAYLWQIEGDDTLVDNFLDYLLAEASILETCSLRFGG